MAAALALLRALWLDDERRRRHVLYRALARLDDARFSALVGARAPSAKKSDAARLAPQTQRDARLLHLVLAYLPTAGENEIDDTVPSARCGVSLRAELIVRRAACQLSRIHRLTDAAPGRRDE